MQNAPCRTLIVAFFLRGAAKPDGSRASVPRLARDNDDEPKISDDDTFAFEAAARFNEGISANIDAIDTALTTIMAGNVALLVLIIDKIKELPAREAATAALLMGLSTAVCVVAYIVGFSFRASNRDGARPRAFVPDLMRCPEDAMSIAILDLIRASENNLAVRSVKKGLALLGIALLFAAAVILALARLSGNMV